MSPRTVNLLAAVALEHDRDALAAALREHTGLSLRRTGSMAALAALASRLCLQQAPMHANGEPPRLPTLLLWHSRSLVAEENMALLCAMLDPAQGVMPFTFLSSQPALVGLSAQAQLPGLMEAVYTPWADAQGGAIWPRVLRLGALALLNQRAARVLCLRVDRHTDLYRAQAISLAHTSPPVHALARLELTDANEAAPAPASADAFMADLHRWLNGPQTSALSWRDGPRTGASLKSPL